MPSSPAVDYTRGVSHSDTTRSRPTAGRPLAPPQLAPHSLVERDPDRSGAGPVHVLLVGPGDLSGPLPGHGIRHHHGLPSPAHPPELPNAPIRGIHSDRPGDPGQPGRALAMGRGASHSSSAQ